MRMLGRRLFASIIWAFSLRLTRTSPLSSPSAPKCVWNPQGGEGGGAEAWITKMSDYKFLLYPIVRDFQLQIQRVPQLRDWSR